MHLQVSLPALWIAIFAVSVTGQAENAAHPSTQDSDVKIFHKDAVTSSFAIGGTLLSADNYKVMTAHRTSPGQVEIHRKFTDIFYIVQGGVTIVTGGKVLGEDSSNPDEPRGASIAGGDANQLEAGDVMVIPAGVPHWMKEVKGTLLYFVVKVEQSAPGNP